MTSNNSISNLLLRAKKQLSAVSDTAQLDAELLLAHVLGVTRTYLLAHSEQSITLEQQQCYIKLLARRQSGEPIAYIIGYREFWSLLFVVTPATLIPRPETELLVELILQKFSAETIIHVADLGTGCGAIVLALAHERPHWTFVATDHSAEALAIAKLNAKRLGVTQVEFRLGDWCDALANEHFDVIVSNPPYIAADDAHLKQAELSYEPQVALVSAKQGLADLEKIIVMARAHLHPNGWLLLEHGYAQDVALKNFLLRHHYQKITNHADFIGVKRVVCAQV